jgi:molecular chaperone GrpE (heat shock protein)
VYEMRTKVSSALDATALKTRALQSELRSLLHEYKDIELQLRKNSETGINRKLQSFIEDLCPVIERTQAFFKNHKMNSKGQIFGAGLSQDRH